MTFRMSLTFLVLFLTVTNPMAGEFSEKHSLGRIITKQEIRDAGLTRLSDLLQLVDEWDRAGLDGYNWIVSPSGLNPFQHQRWQVALDGRVIDINLMGINSLARLPVNLDLIEYVEIISEPTLQEGYWADGGLLNIVTAKADSGSQLDVFLAAGNETGDPGPYRYTDLASANVDRIGWAGGGNHIFRSDNFGGWLAFREEVNYPTDKNLYFRNSRIAGEYYPRQDLLALGGGARFQRGNRMTQITAGHSRMDDFFFLPEYGREVPARLNLTFLDIYHPIKIPGGPNLALFLAYNENETQKRSNAYDIDLNWKVRRFRGGVEVETEGYSLSGKGGLVVTRDIWGDNNYGRQDELIITDIYTAWNFRPLTELSQNISLGLTLGDSDDGLRFISRTTWGKATGRYVRLTLSYMSPLRAEENRLWYWAGYEFDFLGRERNIPLIPLPKDKGHRYTGDLTIGGPLCKNIDMESGGYVRVFTDEFLTANEYDFVEGDSSFAADMKFDFIDRGSFGGIQGRINWQIYPKLGLGLFAKRQEILSGNNIYRGTWQSVPEVEFGGKLNWRPDNNLIINLTAGYTGVSYWREYRRVELITNGRFKAVLDDFWDIGVTAQIYFWNRKVRTQLSFRNILNKKIQYHPIGAEFDMSYFALLEFSTAI